MIDAKNRIFSIHKVPAAIRTNIVRHPKFFKIQTGLVRYLSQVREFSHGSFAPHLVHTKYPLESSHVCGGHANGFWGKFFFSGGVFCCKNVANIIAKMATQISVSIPLILPLFSFFVNFTIFGEKTYSMQEGITSQGTTAFRTSNNGKVSTRKAIHWNMAKGAIKAGNNPFVSSSSFFSGTHKNTFFNHTIQLKAVSNQVI